MQKALISGATGFVGANLTRRLLREEYEVHAIVRSAGTHWRIAELASAPNFFLHRADLRDADEVSNVVKKVRPQHIAHLAAAGMYEGKTGSDQELFQTNVLGLVNLLHAAKDIPYESFINTGSSSEYSITDTPMRENDPCKPVNVYGISKLAATQYASIHAKEFGKPIITLRLFSPYGPYDFGGRFIAYAMKQSLRGEALQVGNPDSRRDFVYVEDVVDAYMNAFGYAQKFSGEIYNIGSGTETTIENAVQEVQRACGSHAEVIWGNSGAFRPGESPRWQADSMKAKRDLSWEPETNFMDGLEKTAKWFKINASFYE